MIIAKNRDQDEANLEGSDLDFYNNEEQGDNVKNKNLKLRTPHNVLKTIQPKLSQLFLC